ncbi:MAG TPA: PKD domain-containing protein [Bacteroidales bacterium]|nr:PKD domain-containing protein [Bacteroidales bacterium]HPS62646.1 PKD domain-containing protein [Bacteroidales bacterium]
MKKLLLPLLILLLALPALSQTYLYVSGTVTDLSNGNPIPNHAVIIHNDSTSPGYFYNTVNTNASGFFMDTIPVTGTSSGNLYVQTVDCQNYLQTQWFTYAPAQTVFSVTFAICYNNNPCQAGFTSSPAGPLSVQFTNTSVGGNNTFLWNFGDGGTSTQTSPLHSYSTTGYYNVSLTIGALGTTCYNTVSQTILVWDSTSSGCQASFGFYVDTLNTLNTVHFIDFSNPSSGYIQHWSWDFGDGNTSSITYPSNPNVTHTYATAGTFTACLTIQTSDSCSSTYCQQVTIGGSTGCQAYYVYYADSLNLQNFHFFDQSQGNIYAWNWNFGDPASGASNFSTLQNASHTFSAAGTYSVCLTIYGADSCQDMTCQTLTINVTPNCQAAFTYYADSTGSDYIYHFIDQSIGNISYWSWNFGDGSTSTEQNPVHIFPAPGYYLVTLTVSSANQGCSSTKSDTIYVGGGLPCQAAFVFNINPITGNRTVAFTDQSTGNPNSWLWSFGDGTSSTEQNPVHTYQGAAVSYNVCLTITSANSCTSTFCETVVLPDSTTYHQVYGQVFAGSFPLTSGIVVIYSYDTLNPNQPVVDVFPLDSNGVYYFTMVPSGAYYILAIPFDAGTYLPTYFGNTISWAEATLVTLGEPNNPYNINLVSAGQMVPGGGSISGQISQGRYQGMPTDLIDMILMNNLGQAIGFTRVSESGSFSFPSLDYGTYWLRPELPGVSGDQIMVVLSAGQPHADVVMTYAGNKISGIDSPESVVSQWAVFPNPATDHVSLSLNLKRAVSAVAEIHNLAGQLMVSKQADLHTGSQQIDLSTAHLPSGLYTIRVYAAEGVNIHSKLVIR